MKKKALTAAFTTMLLSLMLIGVQSVASSYANPIVYKPPEITLFSPSQGGLYNTSDVALNFTVKLYGYTYSGNLENIQWLNYSLDSQVNSPVNVFPGGDSVGYIMLNGGAELSGLSHGLHHLVIQGKTDYNGTIYAAIDFTVDVPQSSSPNDSTTLQPEPFPSLLAVAVSVAFAAIVAVAALVYWKRRKR